MSLVLLQVPNAPIPTQCVMGADGGGQRRDIGAGQHRVGTDLKAIPAALALLLSKT